ncbi:hypothetical protein B0H13DRAFT_2422605 [Mycena leptocephala]|nr:hypothetical protein B0H13DRAFT_2422605 [Mycena leptocephala]
MGGGGAAAYRDRSGRGGRLGGGRRSLSGIHWYLHNGDDLMHLRTLGADLQRRRPSNEPASNRLASISAPPPPLCVSSAYSLALTSSGPLLTLLRLLASYSSQGACLWEDHHRARAHASRAGVLLFLVLRLLLLLLLLLLLSLLPLLPRTSYSHRAAAQNDVTTHDRGEYSVKAAGLGIAFRSFVHPTLSLPYPATLFHRPSLSSTARHSPIAPNSLPFPITLPLPAALVDCPPLVLVNFTVPCGANSFSDARILSTVIHIWQRVGGPYALSLVGRDAHAGVPVGCGAESLRVFPIRIESSSLRTLESSVKHSHLHMPDVHSNNSCSARAWYQTPTLSVSSIICGPLLNGVFTLISDSTPVLCLPSPIGVAVVFCLPWTG